MNGKQLNRLYYVIFNSHFVSYMFNCANTDVSLLYFQFYILDTVYNSRR